jgi:hypothetical protein
MGDSMAAEEKLELSLVYDGGMSSTGQLDFYEFSRASYRFSRLVSTIEVYRRTGRVPQKITRQMGVDIIIRAPEKGSFPIDIVAHIITEGTKYHGLVSQIPLGSLFKFLLQAVKTLLPESNDRIVALAQLELDRERERTKQSAQETKRTAELRKIVESQNATTQQALSLVNKQLEKPDTALFDLKESVASLTALKDEIEEIISRERDLEDYGQVIQNLPRKDIAQLTRKIRPQIAEIGVPLQRSAKVVKIAEGRSRSPIASFDERKIRDIQSRSLDEEESKVIIRIIYYDRDGGYGRCDIYKQNEIEDPEIKKISFSVGRNRKNSLRSSLLEAEDTGVVPGIVRYFRDGDDNITSVLVEDIFVPLPT